MIEVAKDWYTDFFSAETPGRLGKYDESEQSRLQVDFIAGCLQLTTESKLLDLCCGKGRHLLEFLRRGLNAAGADSSAYMISECRTRAESEGLNPDLKVCDIRELDYVSEFDAITMVLPAIGFFETDQDDYLVMENIARALKPNGLLYMDLVGLESSIRAYIPERHTINRRGDRVVKMKRYDPTRGRMLGSEVTYLSDGTTDERRFSQRLYTYSEMSNMLRQAGFTMDAAYGDYTGSEYTIDSSNMIMLAQKDGCYQ
jgi:D-alanine-D-alanine ligase